MRFSHITETRDFTILFSFIEVRGTLPSSLLQNVHEGFINTSQNSTRSSSNAGDSTPVVLYSIVACTAVSDGKEIVGPDVTPKRDLSVH